MARFLITSLVLTIVLNLALRLIPGLPERISRWLGSLSGARPPAGPTDNGYQRPINAEDTNPSRSRVQVIFPWKAMLIGSIGLTVVLNLLNLLR